MVRAVIQWTDEMFTFMVRAVIQWTDEVFTFMVRAVIQWTDGVFTFMVRAVIHGAHSFTVVWPHGQTECSRSWLGRSFTALIDLLWSGHMDRWSVHVHG